MTPSFHTHGQEITYQQMVDFDIAARSQEADILLFLKVNPGIQVTCETLPRVLVSMRDVPITSIRRALTNLCNTGKIIKSGQAPGRYGRPINVYKAVS